MTTPQTGGTTKPKPVTPGSKDPLTARIVDEIYPDKVVLQTPPVLDVTPEFRPSQTVTPGTAQQTHQVWKVDFKNCFDQLSPILPPQPQQWNAMDHYNGNQELQQTTYSAKKIRTCLFSENM